MTGTGTAIRACRPGPGGRWCALLAILLLAACARPLPADRQDYIGTWRSAQVLLTITTDGRVTYRKQVGSQSRSVEAPLQAFTGDDFKVGLGPFTTTFTVSRRPYQEDGQWKMVVDGQLLVRDAVPGMSGELL